MLRFAVALPGWSDDFGLRIDRWGRSASRIERGRAVAGPPHTAIATNTMGTSSSSTETSVSASWRGGPRSDGTYLISSSGQWEIGVGVEGPWRIAVGSTVPVRLQNSRHPHGGPPGLQKKRTY
jgi:hypothetical protein